MNKAKRYIILLLATIVGVEDYNLLIRGYTLKEIITILLVKLFFAVALLVLSIYVSISLWFNI